MVDANDMHFARSNRKLTHVQQDIIYEMSTLNLGHVKAFNIMRTKYGGFEEVEATKDDCKNFKQSLTCYIDVTYIGEYDAEMVVQRLSGKKTIVMADEISKKIYLALGDIISFDAIFKTNKYNMVFVPSIVIDNHCRNVTIGSALLSSEFIEYYSWLLKVFLDSFDIAPKVVVTDQDPTMKQAISLVLPNSRHRLCMWHIMKKLTDKVSAALCNNEDFKCKICDIVWMDAISQSEFETQWELIMKEYDLETNNWFSNMFEMRYDWILAYYMDERLVL
ncbi:protein FAR1-RELATED SEQUENCE 5-like [Bidens hawaiensis]|uniref:protein FAR1-RELATED SEQUENCE 5-like n=1 Tax=Bidens hawaiensis TaxID=980011 RepID=UPI004049ACC7